MAAYPPIPEREALRSDGALREALQTSAATLGRLSDEDIRALRTTQRRRIVTGASAALALVLGVGGWTQWRLQRTAAPPTLHFATAAGQKQLVELADGSSIQLSGGTTVDVTLARDGREAKLLSGEAYFDVAHDAARPFSVQAGATNVRVLGTAFDLERTGDQIDLAVYRGAVRFGSSSDAQVVKAGYRSRYHDGVSDRPTAFDPQQPDWRLGWLDTQGMTLRDLIAVLVRQTGAKITPPPAHIASVELTGRFRLDDPEQLLTAVGSADGFSVERRNDALTLIPQQ
jgi:transmembrane sensor